MALSIDKLLVKNTDLRLVSYSQNEKVIIFIIPETVDIDRITESMFHGLTDNEPPWRDYLASDWFPLIVCSSWMSCVVRLEHMLEAILDEGLHHYVEYLIEYWGYIENNFAVPGGCPKTFMELISDKTQAVPPLQLF